MNFNTWIAGCLMMGLLLTGCSSEQPTDNDGPVPVVDLPDGSDNTNGDPLPAVSEDLKPLDPIEPLPPIPDDPANPTKDPKPTTNLPTDSTPPHIWEFDSAATAIAVSSNGKWIAIATGSKIEVIDSSSKEISQTIEGYKGNATSLDFRADTDQLIGSVGTFTSAGVIKVWDLADNAKEVKEFAGHFGLISMVASSKDGNGIVSSGGDGIIYLWNFETGKVLKKLPASKEAIQGISLRPDNKYLADASFSNQAHIWNLEQFNLVHTIPHENHVLSVAYSPDGAILATGCFDKITRLFVAETASEVTQLKGHTGPVSCIAFSPDGKQIATGSGDGSVIFWDAKTYKKLSQHQDHKGYVTSIAYLPDGSGFISTGEDKTAIFYSIAR